MVTSINEILVVDLDGTLLKSDMLHESFWCAFRNNWCTPIFSVNALRQGKAALKEYLQSEANIDAASLPYDEVVIEYVRAHRAKGGRTALVTASNKVFAKEIAKHLQIFDEAHGSDATHNLKGSNKATFLEERFGYDGFCYMGDSIADLPIWQVSKKIVTVNAASFVCLQAEALGKPVEHLETTEKSLRPYINTLRPHQWLKNVLIFLPMMVAHQFNVLTTVTSMLAFIAFSLVASSVYILNDLLDLDADRAHPRKQLRPFASGSVPIAHGSILALVLLGAGMMLAALLSWKFLITLTAYYLLTKLYSLYLKRKIILDICVLALLYTMRIIAGGVVTGIELSLWLLAFLIFFFFSLAAVKRQAELVDMTERGILKAKGRGYQVEDLSIISMVGLASGYISVLVMALYVNSTDVRELYAVPNTLWGICCILLYWLTRMILLTHRGIMHDDPIVFALKDRVSQVSFLLMVGFAAAGILL